MSVHRNYLLVVGRMCGDDEDTAMSFEHCTRDQAVAAFMDALWEDDSPDEPYAGANSGESNEAYRQRMQSSGEGVFINHMFASDSPIEAQP